jgi:hypothetical protein
MDTALTALPVFAIAIALIRPAVKLSAAIWDYANVRRDAIGKDIGDHKLRGSVSLH